MGEKERGCSNNGCNKSNCEGCPSRQKPADFRVAANAQSKIGQVIGIVSGKGGVGKSLVTASAANQLAGQGFHVGILDADITGPSIPKMYGIHGPAQADEEGMLMPSYTKNGIAVMSVNLLLPDEGAPVIWRGPVLANMVKQFWSDVRWGELDYLLVDMPPGTGDVPLTVFQSLPVDRIVVVTSPQDLVQLIVKKALGMAEMMHIPVMGIVENYAYLECPDCGKRIPVFGESHVEEAASAMGLRVLGRIPIEPGFARAADEGRFDEVRNPYFMV